MTAKAIGVAVSLIGLPTFALSPMQQPFCDELDTASSMIVCSSNALCRSVANHTNLLLGGLFSSVRNYNNYYSQGGIPNQAANSLWKNDTANLPAIWVSSYQEWTKSNIQRTSNKTSLWTWASGFFGNYQKRQIKHLTTEAAFIDAFIGLAIANAGQTAELVDAKKKFLSDSRVFSLAEYVWQSVAALKQNITVLNNSTDVNTKALAANLSPILPQLSRTVAYEFVLVSLGRHKPELIQLWLAERADSDLGGAPERDEQFMKVISAFFARDTAVRLDQVASILVDIKRGAIHGPITAGTAIALIPEIFSALATVAG